MLVAIHPAARNGKRFPIFNIPGVSQVTLDAISQRDYPVIQATVLLTGASVVVFNLLTDVVYALIDPRVRLE